MATRSIAPRRLRQWIAAFLRSAQVPEEEAQLIAAVRLEAALRDPLGFDAFAAHSLGHVVERLRTGGLPEDPCRAGGRTSGAHGRRWRHRAIGGRPRHGALPDPRRDAWDWGSLECGGRHRWGRWRITP